MAKLIKVMDTVINIFTKTFIINYYKSKHIYFFKYTFFMAHFTEVLRLHNMIVF